MKTMAVKRCGVRMTQTEAQVHHTPTVGRCSSQPNQQTAATEWEAGACASCALAACATSAHHKHTEHVPVLGKVAELSRSIQPSASQASWRNGKYCFAFCHPWSAATAAFRRCSGICTGTGAATLGAPAMLHQLAVETAGRGQVAQQP